MNEVTTIQIKKKTVELLKENKENPHETYDDIVVKLINFWKNAKKYNQYDEFLHKIQQMKMQELWANNYDDEWEKA